MRFPCKQSGCAAYGERRGGYCEKHCSNNDRTRDAVGRLYNLAPWKTLQGALISQNGRCQRIINGQRCWNLSYLVHHRISPRARLDLFRSVFDERGISNLICLCAQCHPNSEGTPDWVEGKDYTRTEFEIRV